MTNLLQICCGFFAKKDFKEEEKDDLCNRRKESEPDSALTEKALEISKALQNQSVSLLYVVPKPYSSHMKSRIIFKT